MQEWDLKPEEIKKRLDEMVWSFSRVNSSEKCPYAWYLQYIAEYEPKPNAYAQFGTVCHETIEKFLNGELDIFDAVDYYRKRYSEIVTCGFPSNKYTDLAEKTFSQGEAYFNNINFDFDKYEVLGVEKELRFKVNKYPFIGYADAIYKDKETGEIILSDNKTTSFKYLKNGSISKTNAEHYQEFRRQLYLYSIPLIEIYGKVDYLRWNMIRDQREIKIPWEEKEFNETIEWCIESIQKLENELLWLPDTSSSYWCNQICSMANMCPYRQ